MSLADNPLFQAVRGHADLMLAHGRDPGNGTDAPSPLFACVVEPVTRQVRLHQQVPPPGIRLNDLSWAGNNLMHDVPFLDTLLLLGRITGDAAYEAAVDAVFGFYPHHCPHPETGLFPWGEHAQWSFTSRRILANACQDPYAFSEYMIIHDHLRFAPAWFWERMWQSCPEAVVRYAHGLNFHIMNPATGEHNRHAPLAGRHWNEIPYTGAGKDFARHAGFFIFETAFAGKRSGDVSLLEWARWKLAWHLDRRLSSGMIRGTARRPSEEQPGQHDLLALCVADAADVLGRETAEGAGLGAAADELFSVRETPGNEPTFDPGAWPPAHAWRHAYGGVSPGAPSAAGLEQVWHRTGQDPYAKVIVAQAEWQMQVGELPEQPVVAFAMMRNLDIPLAAYAVTGEQRYLDRAGQMAALAVKRFSRNGLFTGVNGMDYHGNINILWSLPAGLDERPGAGPLYLSGTGTPGLVRSVLRTAMLQEGLDDPGPSHHER